MLMSLTPSRGGRGGVGTVLGLSRSGCQLQSQLDSWRTRGAWVKETTAPTGIRSSAIGMARKSASTGWCTSIDPAEGQLRSPISQLPTRNSVADEPCPPVRSRHLGHLAQAAVCVGEVELRLAWGVVSFNREWTAHQSAGEGDGGTPPLYGAGLGSASAQRCSSLPSLMTAMYSAMATKMLTRNKQNASLSTRRNKVNVSSQRRAVPDGIKRHSRQSAVTMTPRCEMRDLALTFSHNPAMSDRIHVPTADLTPEQVKLGAKLDKRRRIVDAVWARLWQVRYVLLPSHLPSL